MCTLRVRFSQSSERRGVFNYALKVEVSRAIGIPSKIFVYHQSPAGLDGNTFAEFEHIATPVDFQEIPEDAASETVPWYRTDKCTVWFRNVSDLELAKQLFVDDINALVRTFDVLTSENGFSRQTSVEFSENGVYSTDVPEEDTIQKEIDEMKKDISGKISKDAMSGVKLETNTPEGIRSAVQEIGNTLGARIVKTVVLALSVLSIGASALGAGFSGEHVNQIDYDENPVIVTNVTFDGLATLVDITNLIDHISTNFVPALQKEIADASEAGTNYVDSATNSVLSAVDAAMDKKLDSTSAAPKFDETRTAQTKYEHNELVSKDGVVYQCTNASGHYGAWDPDNWTAKPVSELYEFEPGPTGTWACTPAATQFGTPFSVKWTTDPAEGEGWALFTGGTKQGMVLGDEGSTELSWSPAAQTSGYTVSAVRQFSGTEYHLKGQPEVKLQPAGDYVPASRTVNGQPLSSNVTLTGADIAVSGTNDTKISAALAGKLDKSGGEASDFRILLGNTGGGQYEWSFKVADGGEYGKALVLGKRTAGSTDSWRDERGYLLPNPDVQGASTLALLSDIDATFYATCDTAAGTSNKVASTEGNDFTLRKGAKIVVNFANACSTQAVTLNVDGTGAKPVYRRGTTNVGNGAWSAKQSIMMIYDGSAYLMLTPAVASANEYGVVKVSDAVGGTSSQVAVSQKALSDSIAGKLDKSGGTFGTTTISLTDDGIAVSDTQSSNATLLSSSHNFLVHRDGLGVRYFAAPSTSGTLALTAPNPTAGNLAALDAQGNPTDSGVAKSDVETLFFARYYPEGNVKSAAEFTAGIKYDDPDTANRTITVKPFCNTGDSENDNSNLSGRVVIPPFVDAQGNPYITDDGTRYKVVGVSGVDSFVDYNPNLIAIVTPSTVASVGSLAFASCGRLDSISLPAATTIGYGAFAYCTLLASVDFGDTPRPTVPTLGSGAFNDAPETCRIIVPYTQYDEWIAADGWKDLPQEFVRHAEKADKPTTFTVGNLAKFDNDGNPVDSGKSLDDISQEIQDAIEYAVVVDDGLVPTEGPGTSVIEAFQSGVTTWLSAQLPGWASNANKNTAVFRNRPVNNNYYYNCPELLNRVVLWIGDVNRDAGQTAGYMERSLIFPKSGVYSVDVKYAVGLTYQRANAPRFLVSIGDKTQEVVGTRQTNVLQTGHLIFNVQAGSRAIRLTATPDLGVSENAAAVVIASLKVTLVKEIGVEMGDIVPPDASAQTGQAADAKATYEQFAGKANRASDPTPGNLAALDDSGNPVDSGIAKTNVLTFVYDVNSNRTAVTVGVPRQNDPDFEAEVPVIDDTTGELVTVPALVGPHSVAITGDDESDRYRRTVASGEGAVAANKSVATGRFSAALGYNTFAEGEAAVSHGCLTAAIGDYSHSEGNDAHARGMYSHAEGDGTVASGYAAHAEGYCNEALGNYSHAEGYDSQTTAEAWYAHSDGIAAHATNHTAYVWQGATYSSNDPAPNPTVSGSYYSHGLGTYNINPNGGLSGFWIGETNLEQHIFNRIKGRLSGETMPANPTQNELAEAVKKIFTALGGTVTP